MTFCDTESHHNILDALLPYSSILHFSEIATSRAEREKLLHTPQWEEVKNALNHLPRAAHFSEGVRVDVNQSVVTIGEPGQLSAEDRSVLERIVRLLIPWRKGPFSFFGFGVDAEWRSDMKWARIEPHLEQLQGKRVADLGCSTGYYMFRASHFQPELVVGFEPSARCYYSFQLAQRFIGNTTLAFELLGYEHLSYFPDFFDVVLCMGIIYHQRDPLHVLAMAKRALKPGGQIILESQAIPGDSETALFPRQRYAKARNVYFLPTKSCLEAWLSRAGFSEIECIAETCVTSVEQRRTEFSPGESLEDFLDPMDRSKTVEGYPAPLRVALKARKM